MWKSGLPSTEGFKFVERHLAEGKWQRSSCNGFPVFTGKRTSGFVEDFESKGDNFCPHFKVIGAASGSCFINCHGCYLKGTYRKMRIPGVPLLHENLDDCASELAHELRRTTQTVFSDGERCDSLLYDGPEFPVTETLLSALVRYNENGNRWLRLTKSASVDHLLHLNHRRVMILSYSMNPQPVSELFETNQVATITERLAAARRGQDAGYPTRIRVDPVIAIDRWKEVYTEFLHQLKDCGIAPDVITLGTYRVIERSRPSLKMLGDTTPIDLAELVATGGQHRTTATPLPRREEEAYLSVSHRPNS